MKRINKKLKIVALIFTLCLMFAGCGSSIEKLEPAPMPEYPTVDGGSGYTVEGVATDKSGKPLEGVQLKIDDKLYAVTDESGYYKISGLTGTKKIRPVFYDYEFSTKEFEVSKGTKMNISGTNSKEYMITFDTFAGNNSGAEIYGVVYEIGGKYYSGDDPQKAFLEDLTGKTTVTPHKEGFTFEPSSIDVYTGESVKFTAVPNQDKYSVSGEIDISSFSDEDYISEVQIYVDNVLATTSYTEYIWGADGSEQRKMKYCVDGLDPAKAGGYQISYKINGTDSIQKISVTGETESADFKYYITKEVDLKLSISGLTSLDELPSGYILDCDIMVYDEDGTFMKKYSCRDLVRNNVTIWRGATIEIVGKYKAADELNSNGEMIYADLKLVEGTDTISEADMREEYPDGEYFEIRAKLRTYREDD